MLKLLLSYIILLLPTARCSVILPSKPFMPSCTYHARQVADCEAYSLVPLSSSSAPCLAGDFKHYRQYTFYLYSRSYFSLQFEIQFPHAPRIAMRAILDEWDVGSDQWSVFVLSAHHGHGVRLTADNVTVETTKCYSNAEQLPCDQVRVVHRSAFKMSLYMYGGETWWTPYCQPSQPPPQLSNTFCHNVAYRILLPLCIILIILTVCMALFIFLKPDCGAIMNYMAHKMVKKDLTAFRPTILRPNTRMAFYTQQVDG